MSCITQFREPTWRLCVSQRLSVSYFQNLISARSHSHLVDYILISITSTQR